LFDDVDDAGGVGWVEAYGGLVEDDEAAAFVGGAGEESGKFEALGFAAGEHGGWPSMR
jgi:hypothetical protein